VYDWRYTVCYKPFSIYIYYFRFWAALLSIWWVLTSPSCSPTIFRKIHQSISVTSYRLRNGSENSGLGGNFNLPSFQPMRFKHVNPVNTWKNRVAQVNNMFGEKHVCKHLETPASWYDPSISSPAFSASSIFHVDNIHMLVFVIAFTLDFMCSHVQYVWTLSQYGN